MKKNKEGLWEDLNKPALIEKPTEVSFDSRDIYKQSLFEKNKSYFHIMGKGLLRIVRT